MPAPYPVCPARLLRSLQEVRFHTFTSLSLFARLVPRSRQSKLSLFVTYHPHETITGWVAAGENRTQLTHSV